MEVFLAAFFLATFFLVAAFLGAAAFLAAFFLATFFFVAPAFFLATDTSSEMGNMVVAGGDHQKQLMTDLSPTTDTKTLCRNDSDGDFMSCPRRIENPTKPISLKEQLPMRLFV